MKIIMIKKDGCNPCKMYEPIVKKIADQNSLEFKTVQAETMPEKMRPKFFPFFYLMDDKDLIDSWGGTHIHKMTSVLKRHVDNFKYEE